MIKNIIGEDCTLDIHGGGNDLIFPHHENEIAQGSCMSSSDYCNYWFHNGIVLVNKKKMSKSLGNVILLNDLLKNNSSNTVRLALLSAHYRQPLNWSESTLIESSNLVKKFTSLAKSYTGDINDYDDLDHEIVNILSDDLNTPEVIKYLSGLAKGAKSSQKDMASLIVSAKFIGLDLLANNKTLPKTLDEELIKTLIKQRVEARSSGDFKKADEIRDKLSSMGILIKDLEGETVWDHKSD